ncbi:MAG: HyaD/HybD family hydrogenase maturation endopeptidase [Thermodesulfovibrionales bacterium]
MGTSVLVLGVGNVLMKDEAVGVRAVEELERRYTMPENVQVIDGGTSGIELLSYLCEHDNLIIIDAIKAGHPPGTVLRVEGEDVPAQFRTRLSPHQLGISDLLAAASLTGEMPANLVMFGIEPKEVVLELGLSDEVKGGLDRLVEVVAEELRSLGFPVEPKAGAADAPGSFWKGKGEN